MKQGKYLSAVLLSVVLMSLLGCGATPQKASSAEYIDDSYLTTKVKAAILRQPALKSTEINVETFKGVVQLSGFVSSRSDINRAVEVTRSVRGVKSVRNDMRLK